MALYLEHFGLREPPFRITPHTDFFFEGADRGATPACAAKCVRKWSSSSRRSRSMSRSAGTASVSTERRW